MSERKGLRWGVVVAMVALAAVVALFFWAKARDTAQQDKIRDQFCDVLDDPEDC